MNEKWLKRALAHSSFIIELPMATVIEPRSLLEELRPARDAVRRRLSTARLKVRLYLLVDGLAWVLLAALGLGIVSFAIDRWLRLAPGTRMALVPFGIAALLAVAYARLIRPQCRRLSDLDLAILLDRRRRGLGQRVAAVLELPSLLERDHGASPSMIRAAVRQHATELGAIDLTHELDHERCRRSLLAIAAAVLAVAGIWLLWQPTVRLWAERWFLGSETRWPQTTYLAVVGLGDKEKLLVPRGETVLLDVESYPPFVRRAGAWVLSGRGEDLLLPGPTPPDRWPPEAVRIQYRGESGSTKRGAFTAMTEGRFRFELPPVVEPLVLSITGGDDWFGPIVIEPVDRPAIKDLRILAQPPGRSTPETHTFSGSDAQLLFLPQTKLELQLTATVPLASAALAAATGKAPVFERVDDQHYVARWEMEEALALEITLVDVRAGIASKPQVISLGLLEDRAPRVTVRSTGVGRRITSVARIPLTVRALDDFGLVKLDVEIEQTIPRDEKPETKTETLAQELPPVSADAPLVDFESEPEVSLKSFVLPPGSTVKIRGTAADNCAAGSQNASSRWLSFQVVTPEELFYEILMVQRAQRERFRGALDTSKAQAVELETAVDREQAATIVRKHQVATRTIWQVANRLDATAIEMTLNDLGSPQARELLATGIITPLRELHAGPVAELRVLLEQMTAPNAAVPDLAARAMPIQQTVNEEMQKILDRMSQWESFVDVLNQVKQVMQLQNQVLDSTEKARSERTQKVFDE